MRVVIETDAVERRLAAMQPGPERRALADIIFTAFGAVTIGELPSPTEQRLAVLRLNAFKSGGER